jgi:hypothetical protein
MPDYMNFGTCHARVGLLVLRDCGKPAVASCHLCGRALCEAHQVLTEEGPTCPDCVAMRGEFHTPTDEVAAARTRRHYYNDYGYTPHYAGNTHFYSDTDYRTFDQQQASLGSQAAPAAAAAAGEDDSWSGQQDGSSGKDDLDDFMES